MAFSSNGTVVARLAGGLYNTVLSNATYMEVATQDPSTLANTLYSRDFAKSTDLAVATTLLANLGLSAEAGLDAWVAAQLTAAGAANKGAKIVSLLNDFAGLTADAKWGTYATSFNTKVDAALAASQKDASVTGVFATAGSVAVASATFTLTTGADTFTGGAGNNTFNATNLTLGALDSITGGAAADTLNIVSDVAVGSLKGTITGVETLNVTSANAAGTGAVGGLASAATIAAKQSQTYDWAGSSVVIGGSVVLNIGGVLTTLATVTDTSVMATNVAAAINTTLNAAYGTSGTTYASASSAVVTYNSPTAGKALPAITFTKGTSNTTLVAPTAVVVQANQTTADAVSAATFTAPTGTTAFTVISDTSAYLGAKSTTDTVVSAGGVVKLATTKTADISAGDSVMVTGATGSVKIATAPPATSLTGIFAVTAGGTATDAAGIAVQGGTTVNISVDNYSYGQNTAKIQVGAVPSDYAGTTTSTYPYVIGNLSKNPTGDVTITSVTNSKSSSTGKTTANYSTGAVEVYTNGATTVTVKGVGGTGSIVQDVQTQTTTPSVGATAVAGTSTLSTVNLAGVSGSVTVKSDAISKLSIADTLTAQTITVSGSSSTSSNKGALNVELSNAGKSGAVVTVSAPNVTSVTVSSGAAAVDTIKAAASVTSNTSSASTVTLNTPKATSVAFTNTLAVTLSAQDTTNFAKVASITASGSGNVTLGDVSTLHAAAQALTTIDASASSGKLSVTVGATDAVHGLTVKGGSGADTVTITGGAIGNTTTSSGTVVTTSIDLGAGNDKLLYALSASIAAGANVDGGAGTDTISYNFLNSGISGLIKNFELIDIGGSAAASYDMSLYTASSFNGLSVSAATSGAVTVSKLAGTDVGVNVTSSASTTAIGAITANLTTSTGTSDTATINFAPTLLAATATATMAGFTSTGIEAINVSSTQGQAATTTNYVGKGVIELVTDTGNTTASIVITGEGAFTLGKYNTASTTYSAGSTGYLSGFAQNTATTTATADSVAALTLIDASASTGAQVIVAGTSTGLNAGSTYNNKYAGLTIKGGSAADTLVNTAAAGVVNGGAGADTIIVTGAASVVDGGSGADTIYVFGAVNATLTGGTGNNTYVLNGATAGTAFATAPKMVSITDYKLTDTLQIGDASPFTKVSVASATSFQAALETTMLDAYTNSGTSYFVWSGDIYVVTDRGTSGLSAEDSIVKLVGITSLTGLTGDATTGLVGLSS